MVKHLGYEENNNIICISRRNADGLHKQRGKTNYRQRYETGTDIDAGMGQGVPAE